MHSPIEGEPQPHLFIHPEVIQIHVERGDPIPVGTVKLLWVIHQLLHEDVLHDRSE